MELSNIEIKGFKSFGDKVSIHFDKGITGIVGPNGCGKSNVVDAIRWVLGEQKIKALRSDKLENIIFNGTKSRKPTQLAEVSLSFENTRNVLPTEYSEVTICRRFYRSGDSEYELNGVPCRLKDITNLFLDTGIASHSYAIIELKMVDDILADKDNSRKGLFEEAAGISKFRIRKKETLRKLGDTDADLDRVEDLLFEIEKNLKSLKKQARQAERYYKLKEEYKRLSIELAQKSARHQLEALQELQERIQQEQDQKISLQAKLADLNSQVEKAKAELIKKEKNLAAGQKTLNDHVESIRQYESAKQVNNERLKFLNEQSEGLKTQIDNDKKTRDRTSFSLRGLEQEREQAEKDKSALEMFCSKLKDEYEGQKEKTGKVQQQLLELNQSLKSLQQESFELKKTSEIKEIQLHTLQQELSKADSDTTEKSASLVEFESKSIQLSSEMEEKGKLLSKMKRAGDRLQTRIEETAQTIEVVREELSQVTRKLDSTRNEYSLTKSLVDNLEGFPEAIRFLRKHSNWGKKAPLLSDIISCPEEYRVTIENFLEPYMNYYVVEEEAQALQAVNLLSDAAKGKANFFVLKSFQNFEAYPAKIYGNTTPATEIVEFEGKFRKLVSWLLDHVYIVNGDFGDIPEDEDSVFITKNGKVTISKHSIIGGSIGLFEGKRIGRAKNLEKLDREIKSFQVKIDQINQHLEKKQTELTRLKETTKRYAIEQQTVQINRLNETYVALRTKQEQYDQLLSSNVTKSEDIIENSKALEKELTALKPNVEDKGKKLRSLEDQSNQLTAQYNLESQNLNDKSNDYNQENIRVHQQDNRLNGLVQEISFKESMLKDASGSIEKNRKELNGVRGEISELLKNSESSDEHLIELYAHKEKLDGDVNETERNYYSHRGKIDQLEVDARDLQRNRESIDTVLMELQNAIGEAKLELSSVKERLSVEFNLKLDELINDETQKDEHEQSEEGLGEKVERMRDRIERMGPVNPMAMEAYQEIKERHVFIREQKDDLIKAKTNLLSTIDEIDAVARETFLEAFGRIKENFVKVFRTLFTNEDDCDLRLSDPLDPLESSVEIIAKPKGKKPLTINQLSGGEKTLTAISVLFAIYLLKPAPFCIFDEVDAPLDDDNIDKFNKIIQDFSSESQFIIVTHNKRTMSAIDIIYGITMVEQGVSKVVPVDLRELA